MAQRSFANATALPRDRKYDTTLPLKKGKTTLQYDTILLLEKFQKMTLTVAEMYFVHFFSYLY